VALVSNLTLTLNCHINYVYSIVYEQYCHRDSYSE